MSDKLSIGTAQFGMNYGINNKDGEVNQNEIKRILDFAYINDIKSLDAAKSYGQSESKIGQYIKNIFIEILVFSKRIIRFVLAMILYDYPH